MIRKRPHCSREGIGKDGDENDGGAVVEGRSDRLLVVEQRRDDQG